MTIENKPRAPDNIADPAIRCHDAQTLLVPGKLLGHGHSDCGADAGTILGMD